MEKGQGPLTPDLGPEMNPKEEKKIWWKGFASGAAVCILLLAAFCLLAQPSALTVLREGGLTQAQANELVDKVDALLRKLDESYLEKLDTEALLDGAYHGLVTAVGDKYTRYYTEEEYTEYKESSSGEYVGIGVTVTLAEQGGALITKVEESGPAAEAGLQEGDILLAADGTDLTDLDLNDMVKLIKGKEGTKVQITYQKAGSRQKTVVEVTRRTIQSRTVNSRMLESDIGYIAVTSFEGVTTEQFRSALSELREQGMKGLIVDLRDNPGGRVDVVQAVTDELVPAGIITYTEDKYGNREIYESNEEPYLNLPLVVLINGNSASAAEIMAGAIQDTGVGTLVGTTTFGKGIVQQTSAFPDGTAVKITMAKYYTPNGNYIHQIGIEPDITIDLPDGVTLSSLESPEEDIQLQTALEALKTKMGR